MTFVIFCVKDISFQVVVDGRSYILSFLTCAYTCHQKIQSRIRSLIEVGAYDGLNRYDVVVLHELLLTADALLFSMSFLAHCR